MTKIDDQSEETLKGAIFQLQDSDGEIVKDNLATDGYGILEVKDLAPGDYQFVETQAPTGYEKDDTAIEFTITKAQAKAAEVEKPIQNHQRSQVQSH